MQHRLEDLSGQLTADHLEKIQSAFKEEGWDVGIAEILNVARECTLSNHWKDIIHAVLTEEEEPEPSDQQPPAEESTPPVQLPQPAKRKAPRQRKASTT